jgi:hypothetical protein
VRTSLHHQSEAQPPNGPLTAATSPDTPSTCPATQSGLCRGVVMMPLADLAQLVIALNVTGADLHLPWLGRSRPDAYSGPKSRQFRA